MRPPTTLAAEYREQAAYDWEAEQDDVLVEALTRRERDVLRLLAEGYTGPEIAQHLTLALSTVKCYIQHLYGKLGVHGKRQAVARARNLGLLGVAGPGTAASLVARGLQPALPAPGTDSGLLAEVAHLVIRDSDLAWASRQAPDHSLVGRLQALAAHVPEGFVLLLIKPASGAAIVSEAA